MTGTTRSDPSEPPSFWQRFSLSLGVQSLILCFSRSFHTLSSFFRFFSTFCYFSRIFSFFFNFPFILYSVFFPFFSRLFSPFLPFFLCFSFLNYFLFFSIFHFCSPGLHHCTPLLRWRDVATASSVSTWMRPASLTCCP